MITRIKKGFLEIALTKIFKALNKGNGSFESISRMNSPYGYFGKA